MKINNKNLNLPETLGVITVNDREPSIRLQALVGLFWFDGPCMYKFYSTNENIDNKLNLPNGGCLP